MMRALLFATALAGCTYVDDEMYEARLDLDGDGVSWPEDCDDGEAALSEWHTFYADADGDGFGDPDSAESFCSQPQGYVTDATDCDDADPNLTDGADWFSDGDADGFGGGTSVFACEPPVGFVAGSDDCDDADASVNPAGVELCDALDTDEDCDGLADDLDADGAAGGTQWYVDADEDGYGAGEMQVSCDPPDASSDLDTDCDDTNATAHPGGREVCDADDVDEDCSGLADSADPGITDVLDWYADTDADGFGDAASSVLACDPPEGHVADDTDCDDDAAAVNPGASEYCNDVDDDCDGDTDEDDAVDATEWWLDADRDGRGGQLLSVVQCEQPPIFLASNDDCDDLDATLFPGNTEVWYDGIDQDCDGKSDYDQDGDGDDWVVYGGADCNDLDDANDECGSPTAPGLSCLQLLERDASAVDGLYWLDPLGVGAQELECDMTNGGWTRVWFDDPEDGVDPGWNEQETSTCGSYGVIHGGYNLWGSNVLARIRVDLLGVPHTEVSASTAFVKVDSWDNEIARFFLDESEVWSLQMRYTTGVQECGRTDRDWFEERHVATGVVPHTDNELLFEVDSTLNQSPNDESWGIDYSDVWVR